MQFQLYNFLIVLLRGCSVSQFCLLIHRKSVPLDVYCLQYLWEVHTFKKLFMNLNEMQ